MSALSLAQPPVSEPHFSSSIIKSIFHLVSTTMKNITFLPSPNPTHEVVMSCTVVVGLRRCPFYEDFVGVLSPLQLVLSWRKPEWARMCDLLPGRWAPHPLDHGGSSQKRTMFQDHTRHFLFTSVQFSLIIKHRCWTWHSCLYEIKRIQYSKHTREIFITVATK